MLPILPIAWRWPSSIACLPPATPLPGVPPASPEGVDDFDTYPELAHFIRTVAEGSAVRHFIIHARKCLLKGLNPHQNRTVCG